MPSRAPSRAVARLVFAAAAALVLAPVLAGCGVLPSGASEATGRRGRGRRPDRDPRAAAVHPRERGRRHEGHHRRDRRAAGQGGRAANILPLIKTEVVEGQLIVTLEAEGGVTTTKPMSLTVEIPVLESVALSAGSVGYLEHTGGELKLDVSGGAEITGIGTTPDLRLTATTGSHAKLGELVAQTAEISINDGATAEINVVTSLTRGGRRRLHGHPDEQARDRRRRDVVRRDRPGRLTARSHARSAALREPSAPRAGARARPRSGPSSSSRRPRSSIRMFSSGACRFASARPAPSIVAGTRCGAQTWYIGTVPGIDTPMLAGLPVTSSDTPRGQLRRPGGRAASTRRARPRAR